MQRRAVTWGLLLSLSAPLFGGPALATPTRTSTGSDTAPHIGDLYDRPAPLVEASATAPIFQRGAPLIWFWPHFDTTDYWITGVAAAVGGASYALQLSSGRRGSVLLDDPARDHLRLPKLNQRFLARDVSDVLLSMMTAYPILVDALVITWWHRASPEAAAEMVLIDAQAIAVTVAIQGLTAALVGRERPYGEQCGNSLAEATRDCEGYNRYRSFFSGHTALSFTIAGLVCSHHTYLPINGDPISDLVPCAGALAAASAIGMLRINGDMHYLSDVLVGAAVGALSGFGVPWLLHYRHDLGFEARLVPTVGGLTVTGAF